MLTPLKIGNWKLKINLGFSLIEILVFVSILSIFFVAAATVATVSLRNTKNAENKILATRYGEELLEWVRGEKEEDWEQFITTRVGITGTTWCFPTDQSLSWATNTNCTSSDSNSFKRQVTLQKDSDYINNGRITVSITVTWTEGSNSFNVPINTVFTRFE